MKTTTFIDIKAATAQGNIAQAAALALAHAVRSVFE